MIQYNIQLFFRYFLINYFVSFCILQPIFITVKFKSTIILHRIFIDKEKTLGRFPSISLSDSFIPANVRIAIL